MQYCSVRWRCHDERSDKPFHGFNVLSCRLGFVSFEHLITTVLVGTSLAFTDESRLFWEGSGRGELITECCRDYQSSIFPLRTCERANCVGSA